MSNLYTTQTELNNAINATLNNARATQEELQKIALSYIHILDKNKKVLININSFIKKVSDVKGLRVKQLLVYFTTYASVTHDKGKLLFNEAGKNDLSGATKNKWYHMLPAEKPLEAISLEDKLEAFINSMLKRAINPVEGDNLPVAGIDALQQALGKIHSLTNTSLADCLESLPAVSKKKVA